MENLIEQLKVATAGRYRFFTEETDDCYEIICLDYKYNFVANRRISRALLQNQILMTAICNDLKMNLDCR